MTGSAVEHKGKFVVLLVEDSDEDLFLFRRALDKTGRHVEFQHARSAMEAQRYLRGEGDFAHRERHPLPTIIFSDLHLHGLDGLAFLEWLRAQPTLRMIPCIIYSGSSNPSHVQTAYSGGVTSFIFKPSSFTEWVERLETVMRFWMDVAQWPPLPQE